ncbi:PilN domain-containing protein [Pasteurella oralis]|uniref:PilN domain-containing protein n=1 Tax=Pasteurella oralis TaxID=1071947 RepID=A0ABW4NRC9_9PAST|nr:competence protein ComB [Pasteurella oralis]
MKYHLNLLPWRQKQYQQRLIIFAIQFFVVFTCFIAGNFALLLLSESLTQQQISERANLQKITATLQQVNYQLSQLRQRHAVQEKTFLLSTEKLRMLLECIAKLPLEQGELVELNWQTTLLILTGDVVSQAEFERLNQFLSSHSLFKQVKLTHFQPESQQISFQFELQLAEE